METIDSVRWTSSEDDTRFEAIACASDLAVGRSKQTAELERCRRNFPRRQEQAQREKAKLH
jgi:hypothetical protein